MYEVISWYNENTQRVVVSGLRELSVAINHANTEFNHNRDAIVSVVTSNGFMKYEISEFGVCHF